MGDSSIASQLQLEHPSTFDSANFHVYSCANEPSHAAECYVDLLRPFSPLIDSFHHDHDPVPDAWCWNHKFLVDQGFLHDSQNDDIYFFYANGDEQSMTSMEDIMTGIKTPVSISDALSQPESCEWTAATQEEMRMLKDKGTYTGVKLATKGYAHCHKQDC